jgi:ABC-type nitrate/sulfonate/bicarbonate transport system substrate-binding protein
MRKSRFAVAAVVALLPFLFSPIAAAAGTAITVGQVIGGTTFHLPTYVAMDRGFFKKEGLDAKWVVLSGKALVTAGLTGEADFVPITEGGAIAALRGAPLVYVVGESSSSVWMIVTDRDVKRPADLKGKIVAYGQPGAADYDEGALVMSRFFHMEPGKDYKVVSFQSQPAEIAALLNGHVQAALLTVANAVKAEKAGYRILLNTANYLPRLAGPVWALRAYVDKHPETVRAFIRAIAEATLYIRDDKQGTMHVLKTYLGIDDPQEQSLLWDEIHGLFDARVPGEGFRAIFASARLNLIASGQWKQTRPLPDPEKFVARALLDGTLKAINYAPGGAKTTP